MLTKITRSWFLIKSHNCSVADRWISDTPDRRRAGTGNCK